MFGLRRERKREWWPRQDNDSYLDQTRPAEAVLEMISAVVLRAQPDVKLVSLAAEGSEAAFEAIVHRYRRGLLSYCRTLLLSESRSEDVVQQALLNAWTALRAGTEIRDFRSWLYRIARNQAISALRRPGDDYDQLSDALCGAAAPDADLDRRVLMRETLAAVAALPALQREAILRTAVDGYSYEEVAAALGVSDKAVRGLVYRARTSLREGLAALAPSPLVHWAAGQGQRNGGLTQWIAEAMAGGGPAGGTAVVLKGASVLATSALVVGGTVGGAMDSHLTAAAAHHRQAPAASASAHSSSAWPGPFRARVGTGPVTELRGRTGWAPATRESAGIPLRIGPRRTDLAEQTSGPPRATGPWSHSTRSAYNDAPAPGSFTREPGAPVIPRDGNDHGAAAYASSGGSGGSVSTYRPRPASSPRPAPTDGGPSQADRSTLGTGGAHTSPGASAPGQDSRSGNDSFSTVSGRP